LEFEALGDFGDDAGRVWGWGGAKIEKRKKIALDGGELENSMRA
jgi:hypothetical protein